MIYEGLKFTENELILLCILLSQIYFEHVNNKSDLFLCDPSAAVEQSKAKMIDAFYEKESQNNV